MPGLLGGIMQQIIFLAMALVFARDFEDGYFKKLAKINKWSFYHIILKSTPFFLMLPAIWLIVSLFVPYFNMNFDIFNLPMLVLTVLLTMSSMSIGMLFSIAIPNQLRATELLMVISTPAFILSGFTWPTQAIPETISNISQFIPLTQYLSGFRKVAFYGGDMASIWPEIKILLIITLTAYLSLLGILQFKIHRSRKKELAK